MTDNINKETTDNNAGTSDKGNASEYIYQDNAFPTMPTIASDSPWLSAYERYSIDATIEMPEDSTSLLDVFERNFNRYGQKTAYICMGASISFKQLDLYSRQIASYLQSLGLVKGDKVGVMMPNLLQYPIIALGVIRAGMILVNVNPLYTSRELSHQLHDSGAKALFIVENFAKTYQDAEDKGQIEHVVVCKIGDMLGTVKGVVVNLVARHIKKMIPPYRIPNSVSFKEALGAVSASHYERPELNLSDVALLQYTGGTTGVAKGAMLSHGNLVANMLQVSALMNSAFEDDIDSRDVILTALPLYHVFSFMVCGMCSMYQGYTGLLIPNPRDLDGLIKEMGKYKPSFIPAVNTLFNGLVHKDSFADLDFSNLKASIGGGMSVLPSVAKEWHKITGLPIVEGYGLSETSPVVAFNPMTIAEFTGKIGIPAPSTDVVLIDEEENVVALGDRGEICVKGPQVMIGYQNRPKETTESFTASGYLKTGDIGIMDEKGFIKIVDRKKDMILVSGFNVYPNEIEEAMSEHPAVVECGAIGVPNDERGEEPKLFVVKKGDVTEKELLEYGKKQLTGYKRPRHIQFVDELPKSNVGKILRKELRKMEGLE
ncbi:MULTISPECIES: AMP-binding protein [Psychrobacter]|jgi:long-chain acyl-CoA synthetase|uniref:AMP-binding protein n=1 Tax=Psychrobacter TaxID=497 RepID=UPI000E8ACED8|nr:MULTISPECIES: AMP-binding protein [Psychrobacter]HBL97058.1 long-chain fatty acid--CoA ligase [Psychrobacter sp.]|tara:strand:+ start:3484 stop:5283 length:1800 start_codon:yes stop_codon:yes gene_type:complete